MHMIEVATISCTCTIHLLRNAHFKGLDDDPHNCNHENTEFVTSSKFTCLKNLYMYGKFCAAAEL